MKMTEGEAKQKWCPYAMMALPLANDAGGVPVTAASGNRLKNGGRATGTWCIAAYCMAWRWDSIGIILKCDGNHAQHTPCADPECWQGDERTEPIGHCGLAGKI